MYLYMGGTILDSLLDLSQSKSLDHATEMPMKILGFQCGIAIYNICGCFFAFYRSVEARNYEIEFDISMVNNVTDR